MTRRLLVAAASAALAAAGVTAACFSERTTAAGAQCTVPADSTAGGSPIIHIVDFEFQPASACIAPGTTVTWRNDGAQTHSSTADLGAWDSPFLAPGATFTHTFAQAGTLDYHCTPHPFMKARVVVQ
jgi:plastocyanin